MIYLLLLVILAVLAVFTVFIVGLTSTILTSAPWVPTSGSVSKKMCELAGVSKDDRVLDLGCGDSSILIVAVREFGATCVGVELNPVVAMMARARVKANGLQDKIKIVRGNMFKVDLPDTDVVMLYMLPKATLKIETMLKKRYKHLKVVSHGFEMEMDPAEVVKVGQEVVRRYEW